jgi:hypothetical protein
VNGKPAARVDDLGLEDVGIEANQRGTHVDAWVSATDGV